MTNKAGFKDFSKPAIEVARYGATAIEKRKDEGEPCA